MSYMKRWFEDYIDDITDEQLFEYGLCESQEEINELREALSGKKDELPA